MQLQENKRINIALSYPKVTLILIKPNEVFSFWKLVGPTSEQLGYKIGLTIGKDGAGQGIGGGLCQFTNLIHWLILHSDLQIVERHHHQQMDFFPDFNRTTPFDVGTSIVYNYLDYRFINRSNHINQLVFEMDERYLKGYLYSDVPPSIKYHILTEDEYFKLKRDGCYYR